MWRARLIATALVCFASHAAIADQLFTASPQEPAIIRGTVAAKKEASWTVVVKGARKGRLSVVKGRGGVVADIDDAQNIAANEGVSEEDWFPVESGPYKITVTNVTALGPKATGREVAYEVKFEVK